MDKSILIYYGNYYKFNGEIYGFLPEVILITGLLTTFKKVTLLAPLKEVQSIQEINPLYVRFENNEVHIKELPFFNSRLEALRKSITLNKNLKDIKADYAIVSQVMFNSMQVARLLKSNGVKVNIYIGSNPLEILKSKNLNRNWLFNQIGILYYKQLIIQSNKYKCLVNGEKLYNQVQIKNKHIVNSSTLYASDAISEHVSTNNNKLLFVGRLTPSKRVELLIEMIKILKTDFENISLIIIGEGDLKTKLKDLVFSYDLNDNVKFLGAITKREQLHNEYKSSKLFVFPSISEGNPRVIKEATFFNLPSISTRVGNLENEYKDGQDILFVDFENANQLAEKIKLLLNDDRLYSAIKNELAKHKINTVEDFIEEITKIICKEE